MGFDLSTATPAAPEFDLSTATPVAVKAGAAANGMIGDIPRQLGLTARYGLEGLANNAQIVTEPLRYFTDRLTGQTGKTLPLGELASRGADWLGLPQPRDANERAVGDATRLLAGAGGMAKASQAFVNGAPAVTDYVARNTSRYMPQAVTDFFGATGRTVPQALSSNLPQQFASAAGAGLAGGASREGGGGPWQQAGSSLVGGVLAGLAPGATGYALDAGKRLLNAGMTAQQMDAQINLTLQRAGVDPSQVAEGVRNSLRNELESALRAGKDLDPAAVARLADFKATKTTPTLGMVTRDPVQFTREANLAKTAANSSDTGLYGLPRIQAANNDRLIEILNENGALKGDAFAAGKSSIDAIGSKDTGLEKGVSALYQQARDTSGRAADLDRVAFSNRVSELLDEAMVGGALPSDVQNKINWIASNAKPQGMHGSIPMPFNVDIAEQLKTQIAKLQRGTSDGSARHALGLVRQALDEAPLMPAGQVNPGNLPAVPGTVPPSPQVLGQQSIDAFNQARTAARQRFAWQESGKPIEAALGGAQPDKFIQQFVIGGSLKDAQDVAANAPLDQVKNAIIAHLKEKSVGVGVKDDVARFSQSNYNAELAKIGDRKLAVFFSPEEIGQLKAAGRVASYMQAQPVGSAVNNSNSGAMIVGKAYDALRHGLGMVPGIGPVTAGVLDVTLGNPTKAVANFMGQRSAQNYLPGLLAQQERPPFLGQGLLLPALAGGGLLAAP